jgi:DNA replication initiation complex subunit (GINS family)
MDLKKSYEKLYDHWLKEFQQIELTECQEDLFDKYKNFMLLIKEYKEEHLDDLKESLLKTYRENIKFLFDDFLKMREIKIINYALLLKEIDLENITEAEKLLYNNLVSSIKGYKKLKKLAIFEEKEYTSELRESDEESKTTIPIVQKNGTLETTQSNELTHPVQEKKINYVLVRFLKKTPPLVGIDLLNYGPFEEEDIANLPEKNAKILIFENFAEKIEIT